MEAFIARREEARRFLEGRGTTPFLLNRDGPLPNVWQVPGWAGTFSDHELIALAEHVRMPVQCEMLGAAHG